MKPIKQEDQYQQQQQQHFHRGRKLEEFLTHFRRLERLIHFLTVPSFF